MKRFLKHTRGFTAILIALMILTSSVAFSGIFALDTPDNSQQVEYAGEWNPKEYSQNGSLYKDRIAVCKTIAPTERENYFDVTLKVVAKPRVINQPVDVVVVMDISNTMNSTHQGLGPNDAGYNIDDARLTQAKNAVDNFLDLYSADKNISEERRFGLVTYNSHANTVIPLTQVNTSEKAQQLKTKVDAVTAPTENRVRFTNIEGGLQLAHNLLKDSEAVFKYIVFITDGLPTTYIESGRDSDTQIVGYDTYMMGAYNESLVGTDGYFADSVTEKLCLYGVNYSDKAADRADDVAAQIKESGINIFSIGIDVDSQSVPNYLNIANNTTFTSVDRTSSDFVVGDTTDAYKAWLRDEIAGGPLIREAEDAENIHRYSSGNSIEELNTAFENIIKDIKLIPAETMEEAYTIDPISENMEFVYFFDANSNPTDRVLNTRNGKDVAVFTEETQTIKWWLRTTQSWYIDEIGNYVLSLAYRVRLMTEGDSVDSSETAENKKTTFYFRTIDFSTGEALFGDNSIDYFNPQVEGYKGDLIFTKADAVSNVPLQGAEFTLQHYGASCHICHGDAVIEDFNAESNRRGIVKFNQIPSGHEYALIETKAPEGYTQGANHAVTVAYGNTYLDSVLVTEENPAVVYNDTIEPVVVQLTAHENIEGREVVADEFVFSLTGVFEFGNKFHEVAACDENGNAVFHEMRFDRVGTYNFKLYQEQGFDSSVIYDSKVYEIEIKIDLSEDGESYTVETTIDGLAIENDASPAPFEFTNVVRKSGFAQLKAGTTLDGNIPQDGVYDFTLRDSEGKVIQTVSAESGKAIFDGIEYKNEGVYRYTISEEHNYDLFDTVFFDHSVYNVLVTVTAPEDDGAFKTKVEYFLDGEKTQTPVFINETRQESVLKINFFKLLDGIAPEKDRFSFTVKDNEGNVIKEIKNDDNGIVSLSQLTFDKVGYYTYTIEEITGDNKEIEYDKTVYSINVTVEPHHNLNNFFLEVDIKKGTGEEAELVVHAHGIYLDVKGKENLVFVNTTKEEEPTEPSEPTAPAPTTPTEPISTTVPAPGADVTGATEKATDGKELDAPNTGIYQNSLIWISVVFAVGGAIAFVFNKRRKIEG